MQGERRKQADDPPWNRRGDHSQRLELACLGRHQTVEAQANLLHDAIGNETLEFGERDFERLQVAWPEEGTDPRGFKPAGGKRIGFHTRAFANVGTYSQVPTFISPQRDFR